MRIFALLEGTRGERRAYAAALVRLAARGHEVTVAVPPSGRADFDDAPGVRFERLAPAPGVTSPERVPEVVRDLLERFPLSRAALEPAGRADALLLDVATGLAAVPTLLPARKVALLLDSWEELAAVREPSIPAEDDARFLAHRIVVEFSERGCDETVVPFRESAEGGRSVRPAEARVVPPAADAAALSSARAAGAARRRSGGAGAVVGAIGPWTAAFGFDILLRAFLAIRAAEPEATLIAVGEPERAFVPRRPFHLVALDRALPHDARPAVSFVVESAAAVRDLLARADVLLHAPFVPATGTAIVEALAAGVPLVAAALAPYRGWIEDGREALLVPPGDPGALAEAALSLLRDPAHAEALAARGVELARARFAPERLAGALEEALGAARTS